MLAPLFYEGVGAYVDDIYIFSDSLEEHLETLDKVFTILTQNNMTVKIKKC